MPRHQFGYINPVQISDYIHYQFYCVAPSNCLMVNIPLNLQDFSAGGVDKALEAFWDAHAFLVARKVERITLGGDDRTLAVPLAWFPHLLNATPAQRERVEVSRTGLHWEELDEDISIAGLIAGRGDATRQSEHAA
jgi:hypothetical protein